MPADILKEINSLLKDTLVFETNFKEEILAKAQTMSGVKLNELKSILSEVGQWQTKVLEQKFKEDPNFYSKIANARKKLDQKILSLYKQKLNEADRKKMEIILNKMKSI